MKVSKLGLLVAMFLSGSMAIAQGTADDYRRAYALKEKFSANKVFYSNVNPQWVEGTHQFWYVRNTPDGRIYVSVHADKKGRQELFDHQRLATALSAASGKEVKPGSLSLERLSVNKGLDTLRFVFDNQRWMYTTRKNRLMNEGALPVPPKQKHWMETDDEKTAAPVPSPDGKYVAFIKNHNICEGYGYGKRKTVKLGWYIGQLLFSLHPLVTGWHESGFLQNPSGGETLCLLCGIFSGGSASAQTSQTRICQAGG